MSWVRASRTNPIFKAGAWEVHEEPRIGGNRHTRRAFIQFLEDAYGSVGEWNRVAGTEYANFDQIEVSDDHWLLRTILRRFLSTLILGLYQRRCAALAKRHLPNLVTITRLVTGYWRKMDRELEGAEGFGAEPIYLKGSDVDVIAFSHFWEADDQSELLGQLQVTAGLLRGTGKPVGVTEPMVSRYGISHMGWRPWEVEHYVWRGLYYNLRLFNVHSWDRAGDWAVYNEPVGMSLMQRPGYLKTIRALRDELDLITPYETFGEPLMPAVRILVSRNARGYPGMGGYLYQNWMRHLARCMEFPAYSGYELLEEQTNDLAVALAQCRGLVVVDACLEEATRRLLEQFVARGGYLLVIGAPALRDPLYREQHPLNSYPVSAVRSPNFAELEGKPLPPPVACTVHGSHPVWSGSEPLELSRPTALEIKPGAKVMASFGGDPVAAAAERVVYLSGFPFRIEQQKKLLMGFSRWCGVAPPEIHLSRFANAVVAQNWDPLNHRYDSTVIDPTPWIGSVSLPGTGRAHIRELRQDHPWLAYHLEECDTVLEGVLLAPLEIRAFRKEDAAELPHFEGIPDTLGFTYWWVGEIHPATGRFRASEATGARARFISQKHAADEIGWFVAEVAGERVAEGQGTELAFQVNPGRDYYLTTFLLEHPLLEKSPLYLRSAFE